MDDEMKARALADWALANPEDAARVWRILCLNPGGMREVYLPSLKSTMPKGFTRGHASQAS